MSPLEEFAAALQQTRSSMKLLHPVDTLKSILNDIDITPGQVLLCRDTGDIYADLEGNVRTKLSDIIFLPTDTDRTSLLAPLEGKVYIVQSTGIAWLFTNNVWHALVVSAANVILSNGDTVQEAIDELRQAYQTELDVINAEY